ncbi:immunomodulatory protein [Exidia glandulosa HHB12029]|uniref:Immunomodulatory protein n=1 Tax=Exidia glandulosa HHB12029 TaxID=1314781 RepID=A0A165MD48_EXIGL|nr:immunomodulatory protein [Exidia glandulosa HHB12029]
MRFSLLALVPAAFAATSTVSFDTIYDNKSLSTDVIACSTGPNGLATKGFTTIGQLPTWPRVGGATAIAGFGSPSCGSCWTLTFNGTSVTITAIDHAVGFNIAEAAMNQLTKNQAENLGRINATFVQVANSVCGL